METMVFAGGTFKPAGSAGVSVLDTETVLESKKSEAFPLRFVDGAVFFGPLKVGQVPPLF